MNQKKSLRSTSERRERIIHLLKEQGSVQVNELAHQFSVSTVTIRSDLSFLEKQGIATRAYGGALVCEPSRWVPERSIEAKQTENLPIKQRIGRLAASLILPGSTIILDSGTTTYEVALQLRQHKDIVAMTNGLNVANALLEASGVELLLTGGHLRRNAMSFYGSQAEAALQNYHFDMLFLGVDGLNLTQGVTTHHEDEARLNRSMCEASKQVIVVTDSGKFNRVSLHKIIETSRIDVIITDTGIPDALLKGLQDQGVDVLLVEDHD